MEVRGKALFSRHLHVLRLHSSKKIQRGMLIECAARRRIWSHVSFRFEMGISAVVPWKTKTMHSSRFNIKKSIETTSAFLRKNMILLALTN